MVGNRTKRAVGFAFVVGVRVGGGVHTSRAAGLEVPRVEISTPAACVDEAAMRQRLTALLAAAPPRAGSTTGPAFHASLPREIVLRIEASDVGFSGEVAVRYGDGATTLRRVESSRCDEVAAALELMASVATGLEATAAVPDRAPPPVPAATETRAWRGVATIRAAVLSGGGPRLEPAPELAMGAALDGRGGFAPLFELSLRWATSGTITTPSGSATLTIESGAVAACPARLDLGAHFAVRPCLEAGFGWLRGTAAGAGVLPGPSQVRAWMVLTPLARVEWAPFHAIRLELEAGPDFHLDRPRFYFVPSGRTVYAVPAVGSAPRLGVAVVFP